MLNHASKNHPWFTDSVANPTGDCGDCFVWHEGKNGGPPNNWVYKQLRLIISHYLHYISFPNKNTAQHLWRFFVDLQSGQKTILLSRLRTRDQPDLNLRSAKIQDELKKVVRHWLDNGVSGFRLLSVPYLYESENTTLDEPPIAGFSDDSYATLDHIYTTNLNEDYNFVGEVRAILQEYEDIDEAHR